MSAPPTVIRVTEDHIAGGERENCEKCPIALALLAQVTERVAWVEVSPEGIDVHTPGVDYSADVPAEAAEFITRFDNGDPVEPFEFTLAWRHFDWDGVAP